MVTAVNAREMLTDVRRRLHDTTGQTYDDTEILAAADSVLRDLFTRWRLAGDSYGLDFRDFTLADFTVLTTDVAELVLPEEIADIQLWQAIQTDSVPGIPIPRVTFEDLDAARGIFSVDARVWLYSRPNSIQIRGRLQGIGKFRCWFIRSWSPVHFGAVTAGSTTTITVGATTGGYKKRDGLFVGMELEVTADVTQPSNVAQIRRISSFIGGVFTLAVALPAAANATTQYAMLIPLPGEQHEFFIQSVTRLVLTRAGRDQELAIQAPYYEQLKMDFETALGARSTGEPPRLHSSRRLK